MKGPRGYPLPILTPSHHCTQTPDSASSVSCPPGSPGPHIPDSHPRCSQKTSPSSLTGANVSAAQFSHSFVSDSLQPHGLQHARPPCLTPASHSLTSPNPLGIPSFQDLGRLPGFFQSNHNPGQITSACSMPQTKCAYVHSRDKGREVGRECQLPVSEGTWGRHTRLLSSHASCPVDILLLGKSASELKNYTFKPQAQTQASFSRRSINERAVLHPRAGKTQLSWTC